MRAPAASARMIFGLYLLALPVYCLARMGGWTGATSALTFLIPLLLGLAVFAYAIHERGLQPAFLLFGAGLAIALAFELAGAATGLVFGRYTYTPELGWRILGLVPLLIPVAWAGMLYPSWMVAGALVRPAWLRCLVAAGAMTAWDLSLDPRMVADGNWIWTEGGAYFGVPLSNYAGWYVTALTVFAIWALIERGQAPALARSQADSLPVAAYCVVWLGESMANVVFWAGPWVGLAVFVGMGLFAVPALGQLIRKRRR